jgi:hypothetical protein
MRMLATSSGVKITINFMIIQQSTSNLALSNPNLKRDGW